MYLAAIDRTSAARGEVKLELDLPEATIAIDVDLLATRQVILNLLSNAIKYTRPGGKVRLRSGFLEATRRLNRFKPADKVRFVS